MTFHKKQGSGRPKTLEEHGRVKWSAHRRRISAIVTTNDLIQLRTIADLVDLPVSNVVREIIHQVLEGGFRMNWNKRGKRIEKDHKKAV